MNWKSTEPNTKHEWEVDVFIKGELFYIFMGISVISRAAAMVN